MVKKLFQVIILFMLTLCTLSLFVQDVYAHNDIYDNYSDYEVVSVSASYSFDVSSIDQRILNSDKIFVGKILELKEVLKYDSTGVPIPYSIYKVMLLHIIKGNIISDVIDVVYYGGIYNNKIVSLNNETKNEMEILPVEGEIYLFSTMDVEENNGGRLKTGMNIACIPFSVIWLDNYDYSNNVIINEYENTFFSINSYFNDDIVFDGDLGGSSNDGSSFSNAIRIYSGITYSETLSNLDESIYFKFVISSEKFIDTWSTYNTNSIDVDVELYNSLYKKIKSDNNSGSSNNFHLLTTIDAGTYYLKVTNKDISSGEFNIRCDISNISETINDLSKLVTGLDSVDDDNEIIYEVTSAFPYNENLNTAISMWSDLGCVDFISQENSNKNKTLKIDFFNDSSSIDGIWTKDGVTMSGYPDDQIPVADLLMVNTNNLYDYSSPQITRIITHELGHALGLHEFNAPEPFQIGGNNNITVDESNQNIMRQLNTPLTELGPTDIEVYMYLWG